MARAMATVTPDPASNASRADFFVDGVRDDVEYYRDLYNVERVEALKGPNAMIFGRAGAGGVINRVTRQAGWDDVREVSLQGGSWDNLRTTADFGGGINDRVAVRVTGLYEDSESYRDGFELERYGVNPTLALRIGESSQLRLGYEYYTYAGSQIAACRRSRAGRSTQTSRRSSAIRRAARPTRR